MSNIKGITIEIDGSTTKLQKAISEVNNKSKDLSKQLTAINKELRFNPGNAELIAQKQRVLAESVKNTEEKLKQLREAHRQASEQLERGEIGQDEFDALTREIIKAESQLKYYNDELKKIDGAKIDKIAEGFEKAGKATEKVGRGLTKNVTAPIVGIGAASIAAFNVVDEGLDTIIKKTGATGDAAKRLENSFREVYGSFPADSEQVGEAIGEVNTQFGFMGEELDKASIAILKFSEISDADITQSTIGAKKAMEMFNLEADKLPDVLDAVAFEAQRTGVSTDKLFDAVVKGAPQLKAMGLGFEESVHLMATFEQKGIDSSKALSYMTRAQTTWAKEGKSLNDGLKELSVNLQKATTHEEKVALAAEAFGTKGGAYMLEALDQLGISLEDFTIANIDASGTVDETWEGVQDPIDKLKVAFNNLKIVGSDLGAAIQETLAPMLENMIEKLQSLTDWFRELDPETQQMIVKVGLVAAAIGPLLVIIGKLITSIGAIIGVLKPLILGIMGLSAPMLGVIAAVTAVIAIGVALYKNWDVIKEKAKALGDWLSQTWDNVKNWTSEKWNNIKDSISNSFTNAKNTVASRANEISGNIRERWESIKTSTSNAWGSVKSSVTEGITGAWASAKERASSIRSAISETWNSVKTKTSETWRSIRTAITSPIEKARDTVKSVIDRIRGFFNFSWSLPRLKLPHLSVTGGFSISPPSVPRFGISWYKQGAIFDKPTLFNTPFGLKGVGEAGPEAVLPIEKLPGLLGFDAFERMIYLLEIIANKDLSINGKKLSEEIGPDISKYLAMESMR